MFDFRRLSEDDFAWLCVSVLKAAISPGVHLVSIRGRDGGRDGVLFDSAPAGARGWAGTWVFQFKHYPRDDASARSQVLRDAARELPAVKRAEPTLSNYLLLTSVKFTGTPGSGFHDRAQKAMADLGRAHGLNVEIWDGLEIASQLLRFPLLCRTFFPPNTSEPIKVASASAARELVDFLVTQGASLDDGTFFTSMDRLFVAAPWVLAPGSLAPAWALVMEGDNSALRTFSATLVRQIKARTDGSSDLPRPRRAQAWLTALQALAEARMGHPRTALRLVQKIPFEVHQDQELAAWVANIRSISFGKLDMRRAYERATRDAIRIARETSNDWLGATIQLRELHKRAWAGAEAGIIMNNEQFEDRLRSDTASGWFQSEAGDHLRAQQNAYLALHLTWQDEHQDRAASAIAAATHGFKQVEDRSELSRMASELGRLSLRAGANEASLVHLRSALKTRILTAEYPRVRYDLLWLGDALQLEGDEVLAETSYLMALGLHDALYGREQSDAGIVLALTDSLTQSHGQLTSQARRRRFDNDELIGLMSSATNLDVAELGMLADTNLLRTALSKYAT
jgi:hypothetical protein